MYAILGATGNTGSAIANALLDAGEQVTVIGRDANKLESFKNRGAKVRVGSIEDTQFLTNAFEGAKAVYALIPPKYDSTDLLQYQIDASNSIATAIKNADVKNIVSLSSQGANHTSGTGVVLGLNKMENILNSVDGLNTLHLRPGYFMENSLVLIPLIKEQGIIGGALKADLTFPAIATKDISDYAKKRLLSLDFQGNNYQDLLGQRNVSYGELANVYGKAIGKPEMPYIEFSYEDFRGALIEQNGFSENVADQFIEFTKSFNEGKLSETVRNEGNTTSTSVEEFSATFKHIYEM